MDRLPGHARYYQTLGTSGQDCRGFVGHLHTRPIRGEATGASERPKLSLWHGETALAMHDAARQRSLLVTGGARYGSANALAREVLADQRPIDALTHIPGGQGAAFVLHDERTGSTSLGRDRYGVMPLYVTHHEDRIVFATELSALLGTSPGSARVSEDALAMYLDHGFSGGDLAPILGVRRVKPGEIIHIDSRGELTRHRSSHFQPHTDFGGTLPEAMGAFDAMFDEAVNAHIDRDQECALMLSGGLDSALICASLAKHRRGRLRTCAVGYDFTDKREEFAGARAIARLCHTEHTDIRLSTTSLWHHIPWMIWQTDELMDDHATLATSLIARMLPRHQVVLTGEGADDVFAGDGQYRLRPLQRWLLSLGAPGSGGWRTQGLFPGAQHDRLFKGSLKAALRARRDDMIDAWRASPRDATWIQRAQWSELDAIFPNTLALKVGRSFQSSARAVHMPFVDPAVVEFGLSLKDSLKKRGDTGKWFLRQWACRRLPRSHVFKPKRGFYMPISRLLSGERLADLKTAMLTSSFADRWLDLNALSALYDEHAQHGAHGKVIWRLMVAAMWYSLFVVRPDARPTPAENPLSWIV